MLVVDQFEELFTAGEDADVDAVEREAFVTALHAAATIPAGPGKLPPALVVAAVRADYLGRLIAYPPLKAALDAGPFTVGPMSEAELRLAVTGPAAEGGPGRGARRGGGGDHRAARRGRRRAGQRGAAADVTGDGRHLGTP